VGTKKTKKSKADMGESKLGSTGVPFSADVQAGVSSPVDRGTRPPADNNVQDVLSAIDGYTCGPVRALAQDPPQNSADARANGATVRVVYQVYDRTLRNGESIKLLTITDSGTTGLDGPVLSSQQLEERQRQQGQLVIKAGENWAAWEAMRYTKSGQDALGSRGQGKYAYLWHSAHPVPGAPADSPRQAWRMIILYDTLLPDGEYRLGVRYHNPATRLIEPPYLNGAAHEILRNGFHYEQWEVPLDLQPLTEPGTRIIIPFLGDEAQEAIASGDLHRWLMAEWWRKIQKDEIAISAVDESGEATTITVPAFWDFQDFKKLSESDDRYFVRENLRLPSDSSGHRRIVKRVVLFQDDALSNDDMSGPPQFNGVQILRGGQWITTLEVSEFADAIPKSHRPGFRGFVELDRLLEHEFRAIEAPAHDGFDRRKLIYQELKRLVEKVVEEFAFARGWVEPEDNSIQPGFEDLVRELSDLFVSPVAGSGGKGNVSWSCAVDLVYPAGDTRVDWNDEIKVYAQCTRTPAGERDEVTFAASLIRPDGSRKDILAERSQRVSKDNQTDSATATANFGSLIVKRGWGPDDLFRESGRYSIAVSCSVKNEIVAQGRSYFYVDSEPAPPPGRPVTIQLQAFNADDGGRVIDYGDQLMVVANVRNYTPYSVTGELTVAIEQSSFTVAIEGSSLLLFSEPISVAGTSLGSVPVPLTFRPDLKRVVAKQESGVDEIRLGAGSHTVIAAIEADGEVLASATVNIIVGQSDDEGGNMPFEVTFTSKALEPRWKLVEPDHTSANYKLVVGSECPLYKALESLTKKLPGADRSPYEQFMSEAIAEALVEWAFREYDKHGDEGGLRLVGGNLNAVDRELAEAFEVSVERLKGSFDNPSLFGRTQRELAAIMLEAARKKRKAS
jgi:hypothetical protein